MDFSPRLGLMVIIGYASETTLFAHEEGRAVVQGCHGVSPVVCNVRLRRTIADNSDGLLDARNN